MKVLIGCEFSGVVREAFRAQGHTAYSCDLIAAEDNSPYHFIRDIFDLLDEPVEWDLGIFHPPCTYVCRAGWRWTKAPDSAPGELPLKGKPRLEAAEKARNMFLNLLEARIPRIAIENPRPQPAAGLPPSQQLIQPWMFGHLERKETHLWLKNLPPLVPTEVLDRTKAVAVVHRQPPGPNRWMDRSRTYPGIAQAMATQWGTLR